MSTSPFTELDAIGVSPGVSATGQRSLSAIGLAASTTAQTTTTSSTGVGPAALSGGVDLVLAYNPDFGGFDLVLTDTDLATDDGWIGACVLSAFADRRAHPKDPLPAGADPRGWWGDRVQPLARPQSAGTNNPDRIGSRLWLLEREVQSAANLVKAKKYLAEAFAWLTEDGYATAVTISTWYPRLGWLGFSVTATWPDGSSSTHADELTWGAS